VFTVFYFLVVFFYFNSFSHFGTFLWLMVQLLRHICTLQNCL
jgi:hypothetical protein